MKKYVIYKSTSDASELVSSFDTYNEAVKAMREISRDLHSDLVRVDLDYNKTAIYGGLCVTYSVTTKDAIYEIFYEDTEESEDTDSANFVTYVRYADIPKFCAGLLALILVMLFILLYIFTREGCGASELTEALQLFVCIFAPVSVILCLIVKWDYTDFLRRENQYKRMNK